MEKKKTETHRPLLRTFGAQQVIVIGVIVVLFLFFSVASASFRRYTTVVTLCNYMYYILLMAIGVTFPLITGGVDLSIGTGIICYSIVGSYMISQKGMPVLGPHGRSPGFPGSQAHRSRKGISQGFGRTEASRKSAFGQREAFTQNRRTAGANVGTSKAKEQ